MRKRTAIAAGRIVLVAGLMVAGATIVGLAACGGGAPLPGGQPGTRPTSTVPGPATVMPAPSTATTQAPNNPAPSASSTSVPTVKPSPRRSATSPTSPGITGWLAGKDWTYIPTTRRVVALTFDAGALAQVVSGLRARGYSFVTLDALTG